MCCSWLLRCRVATQTSVLPTSSRPEAAEISSISHTQRWASALTTTLQQGMHTARQSQAEQQHLPLLHKKHGSRAPDLSPSYVGVLCGAGCCQICGQAAQAPIVDVPHLTRAERLSLLIAKAQAYTGEYEQVNALVDGACKIGVQTQSAMLLKKQHHTPST